MTTDDYQRRWSDERRHVVNLDEDVPTGRALVWPVVLSVLVALYTGWQVVRWWLS